MTSLFYAVLLWVGAVVASVDECSINCPKPASTPSFFQVHGEPLQLYIRQCVIQNMDDKQCSVNVSNLLVTQASRNRLSVNYAIIECIKPRHVVIRDDLNGNLQLKHLIGYFVAQNCDVYWSDIAKYGRYVDLRVVFHLDSSALFDEDVASLNSPFYSLNALHLPVELQGIGSYGQWGNHRAKLDIFPRIFTKYTWPVMTEISFSNFTFSELPLELNITMPILQSIEMELAPNFVLPRQFPWTQDVWNLPRNMSRNSNANQHYSRKFSVPSNTYRRLIQLKEGNISELIDYQFSGSLFSITVSNCSVNVISVTSFRLVTNLLHIDLSHNQIVTLPTKVFQQLDSLSQINLENNRLKSIQDGTFTNLPSLKHLYLKGNNLITIQSHLFFNLPKLVTLDLSKNDITIIADDFVDTESSTIITIVASHNRLTDFPTSSILLRNSRLIDFCYNYLNFSSFSSVFANVSPQHLVFQHEKDSSQLGAHEVPVATKKLDMSYNQVETFDIDVYDQGDLQVLNILLLFFSIDLTGNPIHCDCNVFTLSERFKESKVRATGNLFYLENWKCASPGNLAGLPIAEVDDNLFRCPVEGLLNCPDDCICYNRTVDNVLQVDCSDSTRETFPDHLPEGSQELSLKNCSLQNLDNSPEYLKVLDFLDLSFNNISKISPDVVRLLTKIDSLLLNHNKLAYFPESFQTSEVTSEHIKLGQNPIKCDCHSNWVKDWLLSHRNHVEDIDDIVCASGVEQGVVLIEVPHNSFVCEPLLSLAYRNLAISLGVVICLMLCCFVAVYRWRTDAKALMYKHFNWHPFDRSDENVVDKLYDAFVSYSAKDYKWVCHVLRRKLESSEKGFKLCLHDRDFKVGATIGENIQESVKQSRRMIMVLSRKFLNSNWCMLEFRTAHLQVLKQMSKYLILIIYEDIHENELDEDLKFYMKNNTYLSIQNKWFWDKLFYAMPETPICSLKPEVQRPKQLTYYPADTVNHPAGMPLIFGNDAYRGPDHKENFP